MLRELIIKTRKAKRLSQASLAEKAGIRTATLCDFENENSSMTSDNIEKILEVLNIRIPPTHAFREQLWVDSKSVAGILKEKGVNPVGLSREEMYRLTECEVLLLLKEVGDNIYEEYVAKKIVDEEDTYNYFNTLVGFHTAVLKKV